MDQRMEKLLRAAKGTAYYAAGKAAEAAAATGQAVSAAGESIAGEGGGDDPKESENTKNE